MEFYPLQFEPILKERIWGGEKLKTLLNKPLTTKLVGESWELSTVEDNISVVRNGLFKGEKLTTLIQKYPTDILGSQVFHKFGYQFPLLFKFLDAADDLSIQVHPNDEMAKKEHNSLGKTEMWYIMDADADAKVILGFKENATKEMYLEHLENKNLLPILDVFKVKDGDVYFIETGTIHAIGAGVLLAEIQQTSDITYRVYDWDRLDANGNGRELHVDLASKAMNYNKVAAKVEYDFIENEATTLVSCNYFTTNIIVVNGIQTISVHKTGSSFTVYMCVEGEVELEIGQEIYHYSKGDTILVPAAIKEFCLKGSAKLLEIYIS